MFWTRDKWIIFISAQSNVGHSIQMDLLRLSYFHISDSDWAKNRFENEVRFCNLIFSKGRWKRLSENRLWIQEPLPEHSRGKKHKRSFISKWRRSLSYHGDYKILSHISFYKVNTWVSHFEWTVYEKGWIASGNNWITSYWYLSRTKRYRIRQFGMDQIQGRLWFCI